MVDSINFIIKCLNNYHGDYIARHRRNAIEIAAFIYNPRILIHVLSIMKNYNIRLFVPNDVKSLKNYKELLVDREGLNILKDYIDINTLNYYMVDNDDSIYKFILSVFGVKDVKVLQVGVDIGRRLAYAILCDNLLLKVGYVSRLRDLVEDLKKLKESLTPSETIIKIGSSTANNDHKVNYIIRELITSGFEVMVINEDNSSSKVWNALNGYKTRFTTDMYAALNIAFRDGIKISKTLITTSDSMKLE